MEASPENIIRFADFILTSGPSRLAAIALHVCDLFGPTGVMDNYNIVAALFEALQRLKSIFDSEGDRKLESGFGLVYNIATKLLGTDFYSLKSEDERRLSFEAAMILLLASRPEGAQTQWSSYQMLLEEYPEFTREEDFELNLLLNFRNMTAIAALLQPDKLKKGHILYLVTRVCEGRHQRYVLGSKATRQTRNRVIIFERERSKAITKSKEALYEKFYVNVASGAMGSLIGSETILNGFSSTNFSPLVLQWHRRNESARERIREEEILDNTEYIDELESRKSIQDEEETKTGCR